MVTEVNGSTGGAVPGLTPGSGRIDRPSGTGTEAAGRAARGGEAVSLTPQAARLLELERAVAASPDVDLERVEKLRQAVASGTYEIDYAKLADKLVQFEAAHPDVTDGK